MKTWRGAQHMLAGRQQCRQWPAPQTELLHCFPQIPLDILTYISSLMLLQWQKKQSLQFISRFSHICSNCVYSSRRDLVFCPISALQFVQELNKAPDISLHVSSKKYPWAYSLPDTCFLKLLQHLRASCSGASTSEHILWFQAKPYIITMAFPQFPLLSCLGPLYHHSYTSNPSSFSIS